MEAFGTDADEIYLFGDVTLDEFGLKLEYAWIDRSTVRVSISNDLVSGRVFMNL